MQNRTVPKRAHPAIWAPSLAGCDGPQYQAIVKALIEDISSGRLAHGVRLPTHRALAKALGVNLGTVTRAYAEAQRLGLVSGRIGSGTFIHARNRPQAAPDEASTSGTIDLAFNQPAIDAAHPALPDVLNRIARLKDAASLLDYQTAPGKPTHRAAGAAWLARAGMEVGPDQIIVTNGAQQGLFAALLHAAGPGGTVATEALNYAGILRIARLLKLRVLPIAADSQGADPDSLAHILAKERPSAVVLTPNIHNPTTAVIPLERRRAIARLLRQHQIGLIEDDIYGQLAIGMPPPISTLDVPRWWYVGGTSKSIMPGLRVGYLAVPRAEVGAITEIVRTTTWTTAALLAEIAAQWIGDGTADQLVLWHRRETASRQAMAQKWLGRFECLRHPCSYHLWMTVPRPWSGETLAAEAARAGVLVTPGESFAIEAGAGDLAVRVSLGAAPSIARLEQGVSMLAEIAASRPSLPRPLL
jgi:DNA-binding transcriptional MocR family regulator